MEKAEREFEAGDLQGKEKFNSMMMQSACRNLLQVQECFEATNEIVVKSTRKIVGVMRSKYLLLGDLKYGG